MMTDLSHDIPNAPRVGEARQLTIASLAAGMFAIAGCGAPPLEVISFSSFEQHSHNNSRHDAFTVADGNHVHGSFNVIGRNNATLDVRFGPKNGGLHAAADELYCHQGTLHGYVQVLGPLTQISAHLGSWQLRQDKGFTIKAENSPACSGNILAIDDKQAAAGVLAAMFKNKQV